MDFAELRKRKQRPTVSCRILLDGGLRSTYEELVKRAGAAEAAASKTNQRPAHLHADELKREVEALQGRMVAEEVTFTFGAIGRLAWDELLDECPPTDADKEKGFTEYSPNQFAPKLIAACAIDPPITEEEAFELYDDPDWSDAEIVKLFNAAWRANKEVRDVPFTVAASVLTSPSEQNSTIAAPEE